MEQSRNKDQKCPVVLLLDTSGSMSGTGLDELNKALQKFKTDILENGKFAAQLEVGIVCFDDDARVALPIDLLVDDAPMPTLECGGVTNLVAGMHKAMELVEERKRFYKSAGEQYYRPFIVLFTDGAPTNSAQEIDALDLEIQKASDEKRFVFFPFGVAGADMTLLAKLAAQTAHEKLQHTARAYKITDYKKFSEVFAFVSSSISAAINQGGMSTAQISPDVAQAVTFDLST